MNSDVVCLNIRSLVKNRDQLVGEIVCYSPSIILLSEARTTDQVEDVELDISGYKTVRCDSSNRYTGGVVVYVKENVHFQVSKKFVVEDVYWCQFLKVKLNSINYLIGCLYRSPSSSMRDFFNYFESWAEGFFTNHKCILLGDFNLNYLDLANSNVMHFRDYVASIGVEQLVFKPTRITETSESLLDFVLSNVQGITHNVHETPRITDHCNISLSIRPVIEFTQPVKKSRRNFSFSKLNRVNDNLIMCNWDMNLTDVNLQCAQITENIVSCVDLVSPLETFVVRRHHLPWYDKEVSVAASRRDQAYKSFRSSDNDYDRTQCWNNYKMWRNETVNLLKLKKRNHYRNTIDIHAHNPKEMWRTLKTLVRPSNTCVPNTIVFSNSDVPVVANKDEVIAEMFNSFFIDSIIDIKASIPLTDTWSAGGLL